MKRLYEYPDWLNDEFLAKAISGSKSMNVDSIKITNFEVHSATNQGDNYGSELYRVMFSFIHNGEELKDQKVIVKARHDKDEVHEVFAPYGFYKREIHIYQTYIPGFTKLLESVGISVQLAPRIVYSDLDLEVLVIEDANVKGYRNAKRENRFCWRATQLMLEKLAYFHAASVIYNERNDQCLSKIKTSVFAEENDGFMPMMFNMLDAFIAEVASWEGFESFVPKLTAYRKNFKKLGSQTYSPSEGFNCLIHSDLWLHNLLTKYENDDDKLPLDVLLIDMQSSCWVSPTIDLHHFIYTSLNEEDYEDRLDEILQFYHGVLSTTLAKFDFKSIPTFVQLKTDFDNNYFEGL